MSQKLTLEDLIGTYGLTEIETVAPKAKQYRASKSKTDAEAFVEFAGKQIAEIELAKNEHPITEKIGPDGPFIEMRNFEKFSPPSRGKPKNWFVYKGGKLVVGSYFGNATLFRAVSVRSWEAAVKYINSLIQAAKDGKLDPNFAEIKLNRAKKKKAKEGIGVDPETGEVQ